MKVLLLNFRSSCHWLMWVVKRCYCFYYILILRYNTHISDTQYLSCTNNDWLLIISAAGNIALSTTTVSDFSVSACVRLAVILWNTWDCHPFLIKQKCAVLLCVVIRMHLQCTSDLPNIYPAKAGKAHVSRFWGLFLFLSDWHWCDWWMGSCSLVGVSIG